MTFKSMLLHVSAETSNTASGPGAYALNLAQAFRAELTALIYELDVVLPRSAYGRRITAEAQASIEVRNADARESAARLGEAASAARVQLDVRTDRSFAYTVPEVVAEHARRIPAFGEHLIELFDLNHSERHERLPDGSAKL